MKSIKLGYLCTKQSIIFPLLLGLTLVMFYNGCATTSYNDRSSVREYDTYADENEVLETYGEWITVPTYGMVWRPFVSADWQPYSYGHWIRTEDGWTWVSYEPFGWIVYHYGYWDYRPDTGWFWIESRDWSPARVAWMDYGDYVGWAPLPPPGAVLSQPGATQVNIWNVVETRYFLHDNVVKYRIRRSPRDLRALVRNNEAPDVTSIRRYSNREIREVRAKREKVKINGIQFDRLVLPEREAATVKKYEKKVERDVVRTRNNAQPRGLRRNDGQRNRERDNSTTRQRRNEEAVTPVTPENKEEKPVERKRVERNTTDKNVRPAEPERKNTPDKTREVKPAEPKRANPSNEPTPAQRSRGNTERSKEEKREKENRNESAK